MSLLLPILTGLNFFTSRKAQRAKENAQIEANKRTARGYMQQMNYSFQNAEIQRQSLFVSTVSSMTKARMQSNENIASIQASVGEDMGGSGRTADALIRTARGQASRTLDSYLANYQIKSNEIDLNKESTLISTKNAIDSIPAVTRKSDMSYLTDLGMTALSIKGMLASDKAKASAQKQGAEVIHNETGSYSYNRNVHGVGLESPYSFFSSNSLFKTNPVASYYSGVGYNDNYQFRQGLDPVSRFYNYSSGGGNRRWQQKLLLQ